MLRDMLPEIRYWSSEQELIATEYVEGQSQHTIFCRHLRRICVRGPIDSFAAPSHLVRCAEALRRVHCIESDAVGCAGVVRSPDSWIGNMDLLWHHPCVQLVVPSHHREPKHFLNSLPSSVFRMKANSLLVGDAKPSNVIVGQDGTVKLIDLSYACGSPALELSSYLVALDLLGLYHPFNSSRDVIAGWKQAFLDRYFSGGCRGALAEVAFFYLRAILRHFIRHWTRRKMFRWYLARRYRGLVYAFCRQVIDSDMLMQNDLPPSAIFAVDRG